MILLALIFYATLKRKDFNKFVLLKKNQAALFVTEKYKTDSNIYIATK